MRKLMLPVVFLLAASILWLGVIHQLYARAQTTSSCDAVCQALISTPGYNFAPTAAPVIASELQGAAVMSAVQNAQIALLQSQFDADAKEIALFKIYLAELCQRSAIPLQIGGLADPCMIP